MDYIALIENRKSARGFQNTPVPAETYKMLRAYYESVCKTSLYPDMKTDLIMTDDLVRTDLDLVGACGYEKNLIGAPAYFIILAEKKEGAIANASYIAEDMVLKLMDSGLGSCFLTFSDGDKIKEVLEIDTDLQVAAMVAFGYEARLAKKMRFNILTMAKIGTKQKRGYFDPKKSVEQLVFADAHGNSNGIDDMIGYYDNILGEVLYAAAQSPSYLNRQPYEFILRGNTIVLVSVPDEYTDPVSMQQDLGIVMLHLQASAAQLLGHNVTWNFDVNADGLELPEGYRAEAELSL